MVGPLGVLSVLGGIAATTNSYATKPQLRLEQPATKTKDIFARDDTLELSQGAREHGRSTSTEEVNLEQAKQLSEPEKEEVRKLKQRDTEVRAHEQAHSSAGGQYTGAVSLNYTRGPDGKNYATEGSVPIDLSPIDADPSATVRKMQQVKRAALAPGDPSGADRQIASQAGQIQQQAQAEIRESKSQQVEANDSSGRNPDKETAKNISSLLEKATNAYTIAAGVSKQLTAPRLINVLV